jgi:hypothetical protein
MAGKQSPDGKKVHLFPPPSKDFDPFAATDKDLMRHGLPLRPDPQTQPGMAALWERQAARYRNFQHLEPQPDTTTAAKKPITVPALGPDPTESCGYQLFNSAAPFTALFVTWTVPDLHFTPSPLGVDNFHTFVGLGFLDVHIDMTVDSAQNVTSQIWAQSIGTINLPVRPGDVISGSLCLQTNRPAQRRTSSPTRPRRRRSTSRWTPGSPLPSPSTRASVAAGRSTNRSSRWPGLGSSTSTKSAPTRRVVRCRSRRARPSRWSTRTARPSPSPSGSQTLPSRPCLYRPDRRLRGRAPRKAAVSVV